MRTKIHFMLFLTICLSAFQAIAEPLGDRGSNRPKRWGFGGEVGVGLGNNSTYVSVQPTVLYRIIPAFRIGLGPTYMYQNVTKPISYSQNIWGGRALAYFDIPVIPIYINADYRLLQSHGKNSAGVATSSQWISALFLGIGYSHRIGPVRIYAGISYDVLHNDESMFSGGVTPSVGVYF